jgi:glycosyltransferase involved in cell wall biosynthesis
MIDDRVPYRELGRGYPRARDVLEALRDVADVKFYPLIYPFDEAPHTSGVSGVEVLYGRGTQLLASTLDQLLPQIDILWISRPHNMELVRKALGTLPAERSWKILYDAEAIYAHREIAKAAVEQRPLEIIEQRRLIERELRLFEGSDAIFAVSQGDRDDIAAHAACPVEVLSFSLPCTPSAKTFEERQGLLFVGAIEQESPNEDALLWFAANVLPLLQSQGIRSQVRHAGVMKSQALLPYAPERIQFMGMVPDLQSVYAEARVFIAPSRFAAGLPQKVYEAAAHGLPVVASSLLSRQLGWKHEKELLVADSPEQWVSAIQQLDKDPVLWNSLRERALAAVRREVAPEVFRTRISETITKLYSQTARNEVGAVRAR